MVAKRTFRPLLAISTLILISAFFGWSRIGEAAHDLGQDCYACHNIRSGQVWQGSYSIYSGTPIGMSPYSRPISCDVCHTGYVSRFNAGSESHHPVQVITGSTMATNYNNGTLITCRDCHNADDVNSTPNLSPDLSPASYDNTAGNSATDGYPNHDVASPNNQVAAGDPPHLMSMLLSAGRRTVNGSGVYNRVPSSNPVSDYAFCLSCHNGSNNTSRGATDNILDAYVRGGHYFKSAAPTGGAINDRIPCSDCHASHNSPTNARLFEPDNATWAPAGTRPLNLGFADPVAPTATERRALCTFCHENYSAADTTTTAKRVRNVQPIRRKWGVPEHDLANTTPCQNCHNTHNPPAGGDNCLDCHRTGGGVQAKHQMTDLEFPANGTPGENNTAVQVSGHTGVVYSTPFNTKALNECKKCHGTSHPSTTAKVRDADGTATYATGFVYGLSYNGSTWSANAASFADINSNNIIDGNEFCLSCHDGIDALSPTDNANIRIGGVDPPKVWFPSGGQSTGHDRESGSNYPVSLNAPAQQLCTSCHKYHTSDRPRLFPGNVGPFGAGNGYTYAMPTWAGIGTSWQAPKPATAVFPSNAGRMVVGNVNANALNFTDRSSPASGKGFGTTGAAAGTDGFCNACHRDATTVTAGTLNAAHTHEGNGISPSRNTFVKDCVECHNPHGGGATPNIAMIRQAVGRDNTTQNTVVFTAKTGANSHDENDGAAESNADDLCATCHNGPAPITHNYRAFSGAANHSQGEDCVSCHSHGQTDNAAKFGFPQGSCTSCHGNAGNATYWPDNTATGAVYPNRAGEHQKHVTAIAAARGVGANAVCDTCHPGNPPIGHSTDNVTGVGQAEITHMDNTGNGYIGPPTAGDFWSFAGGPAATSGTSVTFKSMSGAPDNDAYYEATSRRSCRSVDCHGGNATPNWYTGERFDTSAPTWTGGGSGIAATDLAQGGAVSVTWNTATDNGSTPSTPPVQYTLYWSTSAANVFASPTGTMDNLAVTAATVTGLTNGTPYWFGVRAKDSVSPAPNATANTDNVSATPTALPTQYQTVNWMLEKSTGVTVYTGQTTNLSAACGAAQAIAAAGASGTYPVPGRGLLTTAPLSCGASDTNYVSNSSPSNPVNTEEQFLAFYTDTTFPVASTVTGNASGSTVGIRVATAANHTIRVRLAGVTSAGAHTLSANTVVLTVNSTTVAPYALDLSTLSVTVPAGGRLAAIFTWADPSTTVSTSDRIMVDNNLTTNLMGVISVSQPVIDTTTPVWSGGGSGITVSTTSSGSSLQVSWNTATDASSPPVKYDLYRGSSAATVFSAPTKTWTNLGVTSIVDSGLTEGARYYYGVRAKDSWSTPNVTTNTDTASGVPLSGAPVWNDGGSGIAATDLAQGGAVGVTWNTATDGDAPPVQYTLYWATSAANVFASPTGTMDNLAATSATVSGLTDSTPYYFGVRAKDSVTPTPNYTNNTDNVSATPTPVPPQNETVNWKFQKSNGVTVYTGVTTNLGATCGTLVNIVAAGAFGTYPVPGRGLLTTGSLTCAASDTNYVYNSSPATTAEELVAFYTDTTYPTATTVTGSASGSSFGIMASSTTAHTIAVRFAGVTSTGTHTLSTNTVTQSVTTGATATRYPLDLSTLSVTVPAGGRFAVIFTWDDSSTTANANDRFYIDNNATASLMGVISVSQPIVPPADTIPPVFSGGVSGISPVNTGSGDSLQVSWNTATDASTPPVKYDLYRGASAATVFSVPTKTWTNLGTTSIIDSGLTEGTRYYYGVRAKDSVTPTPNSTTNTDNASAVPSVPVSCTVCHGTPPATGAHLKHATTDAIYTDCDKCHGDATRNISDNYTTTGPSGLHNNGTVNLYFGRNPGETNAAWNDLAAPNDTCSNVDCHYNATTPSWTTGSTNCGSCHQYPPTTQAGSVDHDANLTVAPATLANFLTMHNDCEVCHGARSSNGTVNGTFTSHANYPAGSHADGFIRMNGPAATSTGTQYDDTTGGCNKACHANDATYRMATSTTRNVNYGDFGGADCEVCHKAGGTGAIVTRNSPHVSTTVGGTFNACTDCHPGNTRGSFHTKNADANVVAIDNYAAVGISYSYVVDGVNRGFALGGDATSGTTEAEICWNCHNGLGVSEWGVNTDTNGAAGNYDLGTLWSAATGGTSVGNWVGAYWRSGQVAATPSFAYKTGTIASTHAANPTANAQGVDLVTNIRCSNCHDVHNTAGTKFTALGQATKAANDPSGKPFLRGTWMGNPYNEDGAPQSSTGTNYYPAMNTTTNPWGPVPRGGAANGTLMGGYWIDQNSGNPAGSWTANQFSGLCELCHGNGDGNFAATEIDVLNQFDAQGLGWASGTNGHVNSVQGASHTATATTGGVNNQGNNIFAGRGGATNQTTSSSGHPFMLFDGTNMPGDSSGGFRAGDSQFGYTPAMSARPTDGDGWVNTQWNNISGRTLDLRGTIVNTNFHSFPCSKCHNPHASRLPRLMITNCLDTKHNTWDNLYQVGGTTDTRLLGKSISNWTSAQNCHRLVGDDPTDTRDSSGILTDPGNRGWNTVTPW